jgi:chaperonin cofactor prefoldin
MTMHILEEWRLREIEQKAERATSRLYELDSIRSDVGSLERANGDLRSENADLRSRVETLEDQMRRCLESIENMQPV